MKKYFVSTVLGILTLMGFSGCDTETDVDAGGTAIEKMCGYWDVQADAVDENGEVVYEDIFKSGIFPFYTYNTSDNATDKMWIDDLRKDNFWNIRFLVNIDYAAGTFSATDVVYEASQYEEEEPGTATVWNGKVVENGGVNLHGKPWDTISFDISFSDDPYPEDYGYDHYHVHGLRHTGFTE